MSSERHILGLSGGKDSTALAVLLRDEIPQLEYVFCDTQKELPETYEYLDRVEAYLGKRVVRLNSEAGFDHWLKVYDNYLPSSRMRWCTKLLKLKPFENYVGNEPVLNYVGLRADENRDGYISTKPNIRSIFPFKERNIRKADVQKILDDSGLGLPRYYEWRSRSGCYFCFFQRREEWVGLKERHPDLFDKAKAYEKSNEETGERYTWSQRESLAELEQAERMREIKEDAERRKLIPIRVKHQPLIHVFSEEEEDDPRERACAICEI